MTVVILECCFCDRAASKTLMVLMGDARWRCKSGPACERRVRAAERAKNAGRCIDCVAEGITTARKLATKPDGSLRPGPRCITHQRALKKVRSRAAHARRLAENYELTPEQYWAIYAMQGGKCFGCQRATGRTKRLAVDHDHELALEHGHDPKKGCVLCVRCLLCGQCNQTIGRLGVEALCRLIQVLTDPPARKWLAAAVAVADDDFEPDGNRSFFDVGLDQVS